MLQLRRRKILCFGKKESSKMLVPTSAYKSFWAISSFQKKTLMGQWMSLVRHLAGLCTRTLKKTSFISILFGSLNLNLWRKHANIPLTYFRYRGSEPFIYVCYRSTANLPKWLSNLWQTQTANGRLSKVKSRVCLTPGNRKPSCLCWCLIEWQFMIFISLLILTYTVYYILILIE